jgi:two-component system cell cycle sensor histidine kinase/response regulator CckA
MTMPEGAKSENATLLVVDDDHQLRTFCGKCLARNGFRVLEGDDGLEALVIAASHAGPIDVLITDLELPRIRGTELGQLFKALWPSIRVLYISGGSNSAVRAELGPDGAFLEKPFPPDTLVKTVGRLLEAD